MAQLSLGLRDILACKVLSPVPGPKRVLNKHGSTMDFYHFFSSLYKGVLIASSVPGTVLNTGNTAENKTDKNYNTHLLVGIHTKI